MRCGDNYDAQIVGCFGFRAVFHHRARARLGTGAVVDLEVEYSCARSQFYGEPLGLSTTPFVKMCLGGYLVLAHGAGKREKIKELVNGQH
jgi:hypothetical protein